MKNALKENKILELKKSFLENQFLPISISAMLNTSNMCLCYIGLDNDGNVLGVKINDDTLENITNILNKSIFPKFDFDINIEKLERKEVIKIKASGNCRPYCAYNNFYIRNNDSDEFMTFFELRNILLLKNKYDYDFDLSESQIDDIDESCLINFIWLANKNGFNYFYKGLKDSLNYLGLIKDNALTKSCLLLFSRRKPITCFFNIYEDDNKENIKQSFLLKGNIFELIEKCTDLVKQNLNFKIDDNNNKIEEIPYDVLNEVLINCFSHADYNSNENIEINFTPSEIMFYSPGIFLKGVSPLDFALGIESSSSRNPLINLMLYLCGYNKKIGQGFKIIFDVCDNNNIKYQYGNSGNGFFFKFIRPEIKNKSVKSIVNEPIKVEKKQTNIELSTIDKKVFDLIKTKPEYKKEDLARKTNKSLITIQRSIKKLIDAKYIKRVGSNKTGHWIAIKS